MDIDGLKIQAEWWDPIGLAYGWRIGGRLTLEATPFTMLATSDANGRGVALALHFLSPCCGANLRARIPGTECTKCPRRYASESSVIRLDCTTKEHTAALEYWLDLNGVSPLLATLICSSLPAIYDELAPELTGMLATLVEADAKTGA